MYFYKNITDKIILIWDNDLIPIKPNQVFTSFSRLNINGIVELNSSLVEKELTILEETAPKKKIRNANSS